MAEVSVARDDWAAAEDAVKLALAASEALAPEVATRELALVAKPLAVAAVGSGHTAAARALLSWAEGVLSKERPRPAVEKAARSVERLRKALDARAPLAALSPNVRRALSVGAAKPAPRAAWPLESGAVARVAAFLAVRDAARFSVCAKATASAVDLSLIHI